MSYPTGLFKFSVNQKISGTAINKPLVSLDSPLFRNVDEALRSFFEMEIDQEYYDFGQKGMVWIFIPDYRARLEEVRIGYTKISIKVKAQYIEEKNLRIRVFAKSGPRSFISPLLKLENLKTEFDCKQNFDYALVCLLSTTDDRIDLKEWHSGWGHSNARKIFLDITEEKIMELIRQGEGTTLEFKSNINKKSEFLETVVAFSNSNGGRIIIGVNNNGQIKGFKANEDDLLKMIHDSCEPPITPTFKTLEIRGCPLVILEIESGSNKPYVLKSNGIAYIRHGSNDFPPSRTELDEMYAKERSPYKY